MEDDTPPPKPPLHTEAAEMCTQLSRYLESLNDSHQYFPYVNAIHMLASKEQFNYTKQSLVTDFFM